MLQLGLTVEVISTLRITCGPGWRGPGRAVSNVANLRCSIPGLICQRCPRSFISRVLGRAENQTGRYAHHVHCGYRNGGNPQPLTQ